MSVKDNCDGAKSRGESSLSARALPLAEKIVNCQNMFLFFFGNPEHRFLYTMPRVMLHSHGRKGIYCPGTFMASGELVRNPTRVTSTRDPRKRPDLPISKAYVEGTYMLAV